MTSMKASSAKTVDEFVAGAPPEARPLLEELRKIIKVAVPEADEIIGYNKPFYKYHGWMTGITLYTSHLGVEIWDGISEQDAKKLEALGYKAGSMQFQIKYDQAVPVKLLTELVQAQAKRNDAKRV